MMTATASSVVAVGTTDATTGQFLSSHLVMKPQVMPKILLVDDDPVYGKIMRRAAASLHASLTSVSSLTELAATRLEAFDVAIVDYDLGAVTGLELTHYLDHRVPMPIVLISASSQRPDPRWSESIHDFLMKTAGPFAIIDAAFEAHEIARIHRLIRAPKATTH